MSWHVKYVQDEPTSLGERSKLCLSETKATNSGEGWSDGLTTPLIPFPKGDKSKSSPLQGGGRSCACFSKLQMRGGGSACSGNKPIFSFPGWGRLGWGDKSSGGSPSLTGLALPIQIWKGGVKHA